MSLPRTFVVLVMALVASVVLAPLVVWIVAGWGTPGFVAAIGAAGTGPLFLKSMAIAAGVTVVALAVAVPAVLALEWVQVPLRRTIAVMCLLPLAFPPTVLAMAWIGLGRSIGRVGVDDAATLLYGASGAVFVLALWHVPLALTVVRSGFVGLDRSGIEAACLARGPAQAMWGVVLPSIARHTAAGAILVFVLALLEYGVPAVLGVNTYSVHLLVRYSALSDQGEALAASLPVVAATAALFLLHRGLLPGGAYLVQRGGRSPARLQIASWWICLAMLLVLVYVLLALVLPAAFLVWEAADQAVLSVLWRTAAWPVVSTSWLAVLSATAATGLGTAVAIVVGRRPGGGLGVLEGAALLPIALPAAAVGVAVTVAWNRSATAWLYGGFAPLVLGYTLRFTPVALAIVGSRLRQVPPELEEAALLARPAYLPRLFRVTLPLLAPGTAAAWYAVYVLTLGELAVTILLLPPGGETLVLRIYDILHYGEGPLAAGWSVLLIGLAVLPLPLWRAARALAPRPC